MSAPHEFQNLPFEPHTDKYAILANVKTPVHVLTERHTIPVELFEKHRNLLVRSYFEKQPDQQWDVDYAQFARHMQTIENPEQNPDKWIAEAEKLIPYTYAERLSKIVHFPPYQRQQYNDVLSLISRTQALINNDPTQEAFINAHTMTRADLPKFFQAPNPGAAVITFPTVPKHQREQWFDLLMHFTITAQIQPEAESLKRCFSSEHRLLRNIRHMHPCHGAATRYSSGFERWRTILSKVSPKNGICQAEKSSLRHSMVSDPDWNRAKDSYQSLLHCVNTHHHQQVIIAKLRREKHAAFSFTEKRKHWILFNRIRERVGTWGPLSGTSFTSQEAADAAKAQYEEAIKV